MAYKTVLIQLADKKLPKATQSEAMMRLAQAVQKDSTTNYIPEEKMGVSIEMDEIKDDTEYEVVDPRVHESPVGAGFAQKDVKAGFVPQSKKEELPA
jgi:hypothetical protein